MIAQPGMPQKVLHEAHRRGVHNDCLVSGNPCIACGISITQAFDTFYGHCATEYEMLGEIIADLAIEERSA
jgi:hypothetical protein